MWRERTGHARHQLGSLTVLSGVGAADDWRGVAARGRDLSKEQKRHSHSFSEMSMMSVT